MDRLCVICGEPEDPTEPQRVIIPKGVAHVKCYKDCSDSDVWSIANSIPCCEAKLFLGHLGGSMMSRSRNIPKDEIWMLSEGTDGEVEKNRFRITVDGRIEQLPVPEKKGKDNVRRDDDPGPGERDSDEAASEEGAGEPERSP